MSGGRVEQALGIGQFDCALAPRARMAADQRQRVQVADLDLVLIEADQHLGADRGRARGIPGAVNLNGGVVLHRARALLEVAEALDRQRLEVGALLLEHLLDLALGPAVNALGRPLLFPMHEKGVLRLDRFEAPPRQSRGLGVLDRVFHGPFSVRITNAGRIGHDRVMGEHRRVQAVQLRLVDVRADDALFQVIEHHVLAATAEVAEGLLVKPRPHLAARLPHHLPIRAARVAKRHHEQPRFAIPAARMKRGRALAVVDLCLFPGRNSSRSNCSGAWVRSARQKRLTLL